MLKWGLWMVVAFLVGMQVGPSGVASALRPAE